MDHDFPSEKGKYPRYSESPRRWTHITQSLPSPVKSVRPRHSIAHMESLDSQMDLGHRTIDFFEDDSSDEGPLTARKSTISQVGPDLDSRERSTSPGKKRSQQPPLIQPFVSQCEPKGGPLEISEQDEWPLQHEPPSSKGYQRLDSKRTMPMRSSASMASTSYDGSVEELDDLPPTNATPRVLKPVVRMSSGQTARSSGNSKQDQAYDPRKSAFSIYSVKTEQRLGVHAIAYDLLLSGLLRDEEVMRQNKSNTATTRNSTLPQHVNVKDPKSPRDHFFAAQAIAERTTSKKVHVVPPPIQVNHSLPQDIVRTPYPFTSPRSDRQESDREASGTHRLSGRSSENILTLSIRRSTTNSLPRATSLTIPISNHDFAITRRSSHDGAAEPEKPNISPTFDDAEFFRQLQHSYSQLAGPFRFLSARNLSRIRVSGPASQAADSGYGWLHQPRGLAASKGVRNPCFSEEKILQHYREPALGKSRYAFVHWANRLAAAAAATHPPVRIPVSPPATTTTPDFDTLLVRQEGNHPQPEGLEFVVSWSAKRISLVLLLVLLLSMAASLLWIFLGRNNTSLQFPAPSQRAGLRGAGDRVGTGVVMGIGVLLLGLSSMAGWLGVSWLVL